MSGIKAGKAKKLQRKLAAKTVKGKHQKAVKIPRNDKPKGSAKRRAAIKGTSRPTG
jgi:hypothetical protein